MRACFTVLFFLVATPVYAGNSAGQQAHDFVLDLFQGFQTIYAPDNADTEQALIDYYHKHFDQELIGRFVLGGYSRRASEEQIARFQALLPRFILAQVGPHIQEYLSKDTADTLEVQSVKPLKKQHQMVQVVYKGAKSITINVRVRPIQGALKVLDVQVAGISMLLAQRDLVASMLKQNNGDIDAFLAQVAQRNKA